MRKPPAFLKQYFWDIDFDKLDYRTHPRFVIERILEYGNESAITWMKRNFSQTQMINALARSRQLTQRSANFWVLIFGLKKEKIKCLSRFFQEIRKQFWPY